MSAVEMLQGSYSTWATRKKGGKKSYLAFLSEECNGVGGCLIFFFVKYLDGPLLLVLSSMSCY